MDVLALESTVLSHLEVKVYGGIALNGTVGGLNPRAVELSLRMGGKIVWFPTMSSGPHIDFHQHHTNGGFPTSTLKLMPEAKISVFDDNGKLKPEVHDIIVLIKETDAILASGHMSPPEVFAVFEAAKKAGVEKLLVQHPDFVLGITHDDARRLAQMGAFIEHSIGMYYRESEEWPISKLMEWVEVVGPEHTSFGSDVGQATSPSPAETFEKVSDLLLDAGMHERDIRLMLSDNPGALLGLN
jgi:hypothetical protein